MVKIITGLFFLNTLFQSNMEFCKILFRTEGVENAYPQLSADTRKILYQSNATGHWQLMIFDQNTNVHTEITKDKFSNSMADWSEDNEWIVFVSDRDGNEEIYIMRTNGKDMKRITNDKGSDIHPHFSPDGKQLLFSSNRGNGKYDIYKYTIKTNVTERLTFTKEDELFARYSPDMKKIVYSKMSENNLTDDVFVLNVTTQKTENLTNTPDELDGWPMFNKTGDWIYYSAMKNGSRCIFKMKPDGSDVTQITFPTEQDNEEHARVCISKDEKTLIFNKKKGKTISIWTHNLNPS
jgi:Tol biopolymer transport system component